MKFKSSIEKSEIKYKCGKYISNLEEKTNIFDLKIIILFLIIFFLLVLPTSIYIPNFLGISDLQASNILSIIIGALTSILGVLIAIIVVAFNILRKSYNIYAFRTFFRNNKKLSELITIYVLTIIIAFIALILIKNPLKPQIINLIYLSIILFIISVFLIFPYSNAIISSTQSKENIRKIVNKINNDTVKVYSIKSDIMPSFSLLGIEENPIFVLNELGTRTLKDNDWLTSIYILDECEQKLFDLLDDHLKKNGNNEEKNHERGNIIKIFLLIVKPIAYQAIKTQNEGVLQNILGFIEHLHYFGAQNKMVWYEIDTLNKFIKNLLDETIRDKLDNITYMGLSMIVRILDGHLKNNVPLEDEISKLQYWKNKNFMEDSDPQKDIQWDKISRNYTDIIKEITINAIELHNEEIVENGLTSLLDIIRNVLVMPLGDFQKFDLVKNCCWGINDIVKTNMKSNIHKNTFYLTYFQITIKEAFESTGKILKTIFYSYAYCYMTLARNGMLDSYSLNMLGALGRGFTTKIDENDLYKESLIFIVTLFDKIRETIEDQNTDNQDIYVEICEQVISIRDWMKKENKEDKRVDKEIDNVLSNFKDYEDKKEQLKIENSNNNWPYFE